MRVPSQDTAGSYFIFVVDTVVGTIWEMLTMTFQRLAAIPVTAAPPRYHGGRRRRGGYAGGGQLIAYRETTTTTRTLLMAGRISRDPTSYQERTGSKPTRRLPEPRLYLGDNPINSLPMAPPNPLPEVTLPVYRPASPDTGKIGTWPIRDA